MKPYLFLLLLFWASATSAQLTEAQKRRTALVVKDAISDFQSSLGLVLGSPPKSQDINERNRAIEAIKEYVAPNCRFQNDLLIAGQKGSPYINFSEYFTRAPLDYPNGLMFDIDLGKIEFSDNFHSTAQGTLVEVFAKKNLSGTHKNGSELYIDNIPCRIGVYVNAIGNTAKGCKISFIDIDLSQKGKTFSLNDSNPLDFLTLDEVLVNVAKNINAELQKSGLKKVQVTTFTFDNQEVIDDFGIKVTGMFRNELAKLNPQLEITVPSRSWENQTQIKGGYRQKGNFVEFSAEIIDEKKTALGKTVIDRLPHKNLAPSDEVVPVIAPPKALLEDAGEVNRVMENPQALPNVTGLKFDIVTNRGINSLVYEENDTMRLAVRVNKPCMVRLIYRQANNKLVLLRNQDFPINDWEINKWIDIPEDFVCADPYGAEFLIAYACTAPLEMLKTHKEGDYVIIDNTLAETKALSTTPGRGVKNAGVSVVEQKLQITTRERRK
ncbi:hypothetical protein [Runella sp.]|jgi:hypothetical protein|uniref:hypothetical protein n=1 Tax=Runella sp. TaxID=1960881 RepID=UPI0030199825